MKMVICSSRTIVTVTVNVPKEPSHGALQGGVQRGAGGEGWKEHSGERQWEQEGKVAVPGH